MNEDGTIGRTCYRIQSLIIFLGRMISGHIKVEKKNEVSREEK